MGKGDIKTKKGKRSAGSYGNSRPKKVAKSTVVVEKKKKATPKAKPATASDAKNTSKITAKKTATKKPAAKKTAAKKTTKK